MFRRDDDFVIVAELPGVEKSDLDIQIKDRNVRITGKKGVSFDDGVSIHRRERVAGDFDRTLAIPARIDADSARAEYRDGVLFVYLPRAEADKATTISIN